MARERKERIHGPYPHGNRYRIVIDGADGSRTTASYASAQEAKQVADELVGAIEGRTVSTAVRAYLADMGARGLKPQTVTTAEYRLTAMLRLDETGRLSLRSLSPRRAAELYKRRAAEAKPDTHRNELAMARAFATWCRRKGWLPANPFADVEAIGQRSTGKPQLRVNEARQFLDRALGEGTAAGLACAMPLLMGLRASEVTNRVVRDVDNNGQLLWIEKAKTRAGDRHLEVPGVLVPRLLRLAANRDAAEPLFGAGNDRQWLYYHTGRIATEAGVPHTTPHALRGLHATLAVSSGESVASVARSLGHAHVEVTRRHYLGPGAEQDASSRTVLGVLVGGVVTRSDFDLPATIDVDDTDEKPE